MRIASFALAFAVLVTARIASADDPYDESYGYDASALPGEGIADVAVFYDQLSPHGVWVDEPRMGRVFIPDVDGYVPYTNGNWQSTNVGLVWVSDEPFAWATSHYGRWAFSPAYGRWVWLPDTEWGPAWVEWRESGDVYGWAPLPPVVVADIYVAPFDSWRYARAHDLFARDLRRRYLPRDRVTVVHRDARPIAARATIGRHQVVVGPAPARLREHRVAVRPQRLDARAIGRFTATESRAAADRARERRATVDERNRRRVEANTRIRDAERRVTRETPPRRVEPQAPRAQPQPAPRTAPDRARPQPAPRAEPERARPQPTPRAQPERAQPVKPEPPRAQPERARPEPPRAQHEPRRAEPQRPEPPRREPPERAQPRKGQRADARPERARPPRDDNRVRAEGEPARDKRDGRSDRD